MGLSKDQENAVRGVLLARAAERDRQNVDGRSDRVNFMLDEANEDR